jgi:hypothetical protein
MYVLWSFWARINFKEVYEIILTNISVHFVSQFLCHLLIIEQNCFIKWFFKKVLAIHIILKDWQYSNWFRRAKSFCSLLFIRSTKHPSDLGSRDWEYCDHREARQKVQETPSQPIAGFSGTHLSSQLCGRLILRGLWLYSSLGKKFVRHPPHLNKSSWACHLSYRGNHK